MHHDKKLYGTATIGTKGQIVIPVDAREELGLEAGDKLYIAGSKNGQYLVCLKEEQLQNHINKLTSDLESTKVALDKLKES